MVHYNTCQRVCLINEKTHIYLKWIKQKCINATAHSENILHGDTLYIIIFFL